VEASTQEQGKKPRIVISSTPNEEINDNLKNAFTDALYEGLQTSQMYEVYDVREKFAAVKQAEADYQEQGHVKDEELLDIAKENGVEFVAYVSINVFDERYRVSVKFANLQTAQAIGTPFSVNSQKGGDLFALADEIVMRITKARPVTSVQKKTSFICECAIDEYGKFAKSEVSAVNERPLPHTEALEFCKKKGDGWRLPTRVELACIFSAPESQEAAPFEKRDYWTADTRNNYESYIINFGTRKDVYYSKNIKNTFRCIRE
jgi:TolB-like protein